MVRNSCCPTDGESPTRSHAVELPQIHQLAERTRALADETRLTILWLLLHHPQPLCVCHLVERVAVGQPTVSHHLRILRDIGLVSVERRGTWAYYRATPLAGMLLQALLQIRATTVTA